MNGDRRRRARVQGGWAAPVRNVRSDKDKPKAMAEPAWLAKTVDDPVPKKFTYEQPQEDFRVKPEELIITKPGLYDISLEPSGVSRLRFFPNFLDPQHSKELFQQLFHEVPWRQRSIIVGGVSYLQPRLTAWFGEQPYSYSGVTHEPNQQWPVALTVLREQLEEVTGTRFNSLLANLYRDGHDSIDWHSDDEPSLGTNPIIASLSFGGTRNFEMRKKPPMGNTGDYTYSQTVRVPLESGSLLIMEGCTQADWQHRVPKEYHDRGPRINLTFRVIHPEHT
ncbi:hypothetical protein BaRGS_00014215 [Batillaria attramentaria]|uniref:Alpha-ketoglutarate-dependent dioxygenase alkB homolog 3 n=1 Tax=Batillaria attramentaria TaxID=370345 RepID=A0ABD0L634_9CAEN